MATLRNMLLRTSWGQSGKTCCLFHFCENVSKMHKLVKQNPSYNTWHSLWQKDWSSDVLSRQIQQHRTAWKLPTPLTVPKGTVYQIHGLQNTLLEGEGEACEKAGQGRRRKTLGHFASSLSQDSLTVVCLSDSPLPFSQHTHAEMYT